MYVNSNKLLLYRSICIYLFGIHCANVFEFPFMCQYFKCAQRNPQNTNRERVCNVHANTYTRSQLFSGSKEIALNNNVRVCVCVYVWKTNGSADTKQVGMQVSSRTKRATIL